MIIVRHYTPEDRPFLMSLAPRLTIGMAPWRDSEKCLEAVAGWIKYSPGTHGEKTTVFVAETDTGERLGFAVVTSQTHFTRQKQAYIGELAVTEGSEDRGAGKALLQACEEWARNQRLPVITLTTGTANDRALGFYRHLGYQDEEIKLTKLL